MTTASEIDAPRIVSFILSSALLFNGPLIPLILGPLLSSNPVYRSECDSMITRRQARIVSDDFLTVS
jgi:hypothetical protein